jgi:hypothetical protein
MVFFRMPPANHPAALFFFNANHPAALFFYHSLLPRPESNILETMQFDWSVSKKALFVYQSSSDPHVLQFISANNLPII